MCYQSKAGDTNGDLTEHLIGITIGGERSPCKRRSVAQALSRFLRRQVQSLPSLILEGARSDETPSTRFTIVRDRTTSEDDPKPSGTGTPSHT